MAFVYLPSLLGEHRGIERLRLRFYSNLITPARGTKLRIEAGERRIKYRIERHSAGRTKEAA